VEELAKVERELEKQAARAAPKMKKEDFTKGRLINHRERFAKDRTVEEQQAGPPMDREAMKAYTRTLPTPPKSEIPFGTCQMGYPHTGAFARHRIRSDDMDSTPSNSARTSKSVMNTARERERIDAYLRKKNPTDSEADQTRMGGAYAYCTSNMVSKNLPALPNGGPHRILGPNSGFQVKK